jgi:hypothetical protein
MFISVERYGISWMWRPVVAVLLIMSVVGLLRPLIADIRRQGGLVRMASSFQAPIFHPSQLFTMFFLALFGMLVVMALPWHFSAKLVPLVVGSVALTVVALSLFNDMCRKPAAAKVRGMGEEAQAEVKETIHMDLTSDTEHLPLRVIAERALRFFLYLIGFMGLMAMIGLVPTVAIFVIAFMRLEGPERWPLVLTYAASLVVAISVVFDWLMSIPWPPTLLGHLFPALKFIPSV